MTALRKLWRDERGTETVEWALILGIIILAAVGAAAGAKGSMKTIFGKMDTELSSATAP